jgi:pimeloyl-ACP methyl ester carboxylesterase
VGADLLVADVLAVQAARDVLPHLTVIGHSYGSTTVGTALRERETGTDDVVLVGSPGPNIDRAAQLHLPAGHVFVGASSRDPVSYLDRFGADPTQASFGATRFQAEDPTRNSWRLDFDDHSKYFDAGSESLANIVDVVTGDYAGVERAAYRGEVPWRPDGINSDPEADRAPTTDR